MKKYLILIILAFSLLPAGAQQVMYTSMKGLLAQQGDTVTTLQIEKRSVNKQYLMGGADYHVSATDNEGLSKYLKRRCYGVLIDNTLYVNCRRMRYKHYRFGNWYAPAQRIAGRIFFRALPLGQVATSSFAPQDSPKLGGEVGDAIQASGLVHERVYYMINPDNGKALFVGKELMNELLDGQPTEQEALMKETTESADVMEKYIRKLK